MRNGLILLLPCLLLLSSYNMIVDQPEKELIAPRLGKSNQSRIIMEDGKTYFMELIGSNKGNLEIQLVDSMRFPFKTIVAKYQNNPLQGASFIIKSPFAKRLSFVCFVNIYAEGYVKLHVPAIQNIYRKQWQSNSIFGIELSDFRLLD